MKIFKRVKELSLALFEEDCKYRCQHYSFAIWNNRILKIARNSPRSNTLNLRNPKFNKEGKNFSGERGTCSELKIFKVLKNTTNIPYKDIILINTRLNRNKQFDLSRPCFSCRNLLIYMEIQHIWYTNKAGEFEKYQFNC